MTEASSNSLFEGPEFSDSADDFDDEVDDELDDEIDDDEDVDELDDEDVDELDDERTPAAANRAEGGTAQAVLEHIARSVVDDPGAVVVEAGPGRNGLKLSLHVDPSDMGRIIGKRGRVAQALRTVVRAAGARDGDDVSVDIVD